MTIFSKTPDIVPSERKRAVKALATRHGKDASVGRITYLKADQYLQKLMTDLSGVLPGQPFFNPEDYQAAAFEKISSEQWNEAQERIYTDLRALYGALNQSLVSETYKGASIREKFSRTRAQILKIITEIRLYQFLRSNPDYQDAKFIDFSNGLNETVKKPRAVIDSRVRLLELPPRTRYFQSKAHQDLKTTTVEIEHLGGGVRGGLTKEFEPARMLDVREDTFWAEMIMAEGPISQKYLASGDAGLGPSFESSGAIAHIHLKMDQVRLANNLQLLPFGEFPVRVIDVAYKESDDQPQWSMLPNFVLEDPTLDWIEINFPPTPIAQLRVTIEQVNYRSNMYYLPESMVRNGVLWQNIGKDRQDEVLHELNLTEDEEDLLKIDPAHINKLEAKADFREILDSETLQRGREQQFYVQSNQYKAAVMSLSKVRPNMANDLLQEMRGETVSSQENTVGVRTYEYVYGIRELQLRYSIYEPLGHYSSPKFRSTSSILEVSLTTEERHINASDAGGNYQITSTEWEVEIGRDRRYPIAPRNWRVDGQVVVDCEFLSVDRQTRSGTTRLATSGQGLALRKNGQLVPLSDYSVQSWVPSTTAGPYLAPGDSVTPGLRNPDGTVNQVLPQRMVVTVGASTYDPNAVYTISYIANSDADVLNVDEQVDSVNDGGPEVFDSTNRNNQIVLSSVPYIDYNIINSDTWTYDGSGVWSIVPDVGNISGLCLMTIGQFDVEILTIDPASALRDPLDIADFFDWSKKNGFKVIGSDTVYEIEGPHPYTPGVLRLTTNSLEGDSYTSQPFTAGPIFESDGRGYGFAQQTYEPVQVYVNDVKAANFTDYINLRHNAFDDAPRGGKQIQFIQAGSVIYFNQPIENARIEVHYRWLAEYVKVNGVLRCNQPVNTVLTPQINSIRLELATSPL